MIKIGVKLVYVHTCALMTLPLHPRPEHPGALWGESRVMTPMATQRTAWPVATTETLHNFRVGLKHFTEFTRIVIYSDYLSSEHQREGFKFAISWTIPQRMDFSKVALVVDSCTIQQRMDLVCTGLFFVGEVGAHVVAKGRCIQT